MSRFSFSFIRGLSDEMKRASLPSKIQKESDLEAAVFKIVKDYTKKVLDVDDAKLKGILFTHGTTKEEKKLWRDSKKDQNIVVFGCSNTSDIFIKSNQLGTIYIELKFSKKRGNKGASALPGDLQRSIGQSIIASLIHSHVICLVVCETEIREKENDHYRKLHNDLRAHKIELIVRSLN